MKFTTKEKDELAVAKRKDKEGPFVELRVETDTGGAIHSTKGQAPVEARAKSEAVAMRTTEDLFGVRVDATPEQRSNLRLDVEVPKGTQLIRCKNLGDRWQITVRIEGKRTELVTFRNPLGKTTGERLGPRYGLHEKVKLKRSICGLNKDARGVVVGYAALDSYHVEVGGKVTIVGGEYLSSSKVTRCV